MMVKFPVWICLKFKDYLTSEVEMCALIVEGKIGYILEAYFVVKCEALKLLSKIKPAVNFSWISIEIDIDQSYVR